MTHVVFILSIFFVEIEFINLASIYMFMNLGLLFTSSKYAYLITIIHTGDI